MFSTVVGPCKVAYAIYRVGKVDISAEETGHVVGSHSPVFAQLASTAAVVAFAYKQEFTHMNLVAIKSFLKFNFFNLYINFEYKQNIFWKLNFFLFYDKFRIFFFFIKYLFSI